MTFGAEGNPMDTLEHKPCTDKLGSALSIIPCSSEDFEAVLDMYDSYMPDAVAQGLPPTNRNARAKWLHNLLETGVNYAAMREGKVMGHASLLPNMTRRDAEYLVFVGGPHRKRGIATLLTEAVIERAKVLELNLVWLTVEPDNFRAIKLYRKMGFEFCDKGLSERKMARKI